MFSDLISVTTESLVFVSTQTCEDWFSVHYAVGVKHAFNGRFCVEMGRMKPVVHTCCVSVQGLHPLKDSAFAVFEGETFRETSLTWSAVPKCDGLVFGAFPGWVTRCFTLTSQFSLFLSSFLGTQRILGYERPPKIAAVHPPERGKRRSIWWSAVVM